jgi:hypothetical protein
MITYRITTTGADLQHGAVYAQFGQWIFITILGGEETWEASVSLQSAGAFEHLLNTDSAVVRYEQV